MRKMCSFSLIYKIIPLKKKNLTSEWKKGEHLRSYNICPFSEGPQRSLPYDM